MNYPTPTYGFFSDSQQVTVPNTAAATIHAPKLSVVIPCYNEAAALGELHRRVSAVCDTLFPRAHEIVLVNDGSSDETWKRIQELADANPAVWGINPSRNHGHQLALSAGLSACRGERILIIDADLQDPPELLPEMLRLMEAGADIVYGQRVAREGETLFKRGTAALFYRLLDRLVDIAIPKDTGDFRLMSRRALNVLNAMPEQHRFIRGMVSWVGLHQVPLQYHRQARVAGETKYPFSKMLRFAVDAITGFSTRPLRAASWLGMCFAFVGLILLGYAIYSWLVNDTVEGWTSLITVVVVMGSVQLLVLGIMGEYLGRLYMEAKRRPLFVVESIYRPLPQPEARVEGNTSGSSVSHAA